MERQQGSAESWPLGEERATALIARVTREIEVSSDEHRELLLCDLVCAAWPSRRAQDQ
jgi:hypothetical protein